MVIIQKFPVLLGCSFPNPMVRESVFYLGHFFNPHPLLFLISPAPSLQHMRPKENLAPQCCSSDSPNPSQSAFSLSFQVICLFYI